VEFRHTELGNGLRVIAEVNPAAATMAAGFFIRTGSRDETPAIAGVSHFLEHMMFKGTPGRSAAEVNLEFDRIGAHYNAFTGEEYTVYYAGVLPEFQPRAVDLLCELMRPALRQEDFDLEKKVILEEIAMCQDMPKHRLFEALMAQHFAGHPLAGSVLGTAESITALSRDDMAGYLQRRYCPGNMVAVAVGRVDWDGFVAQVERLCGGWEARPAGRATPPPPSGRQRRTLVDRKVVREHVGLLSAAPAYQDDRRYAAQLLATVVGDDAGSRLFYALVEPAIADEAYAAYEPMDQAGAIFTYLSADPARAAEAVGLAEEVFARFADEGPTEAELAAAKNKIAASATLKGELPMGRLTAVGFDWTYRGQYEPLREQIEALLAVPGEEVRQVARAFEVSRMSVLGLGAAESL